MAYDKLIDSAKLEGAMTATANAIRAKTGGTAQIAWNESSGFSSAVSGITPKTQAKTVTPTSTIQTVKPDSGYDGLSQVTVNATPTATQATPSITVSTGGLITASATQTAGYVASGTKSATKQLSVQATKTVTPGTSDQTAVASGVYTTGAITVKGDANLKAENIAKDVSIFGITGTHAGGGNVASGALVTTLAMGKTITVTGLGFRPSNLMLVYDSAGETITFTNKKLAVLSLIAGDYNMLQFISSAATTMVGQTSETGINATVTFNSDGFSVSVTSTSVCKFIVGYYRYVVW